MLPVSTPRLHPPTDDATPGSTVRAHSLRAPAAYFLSAFVAAATITASADAAPPGDSPLPAEDWNLGIKADQGSNGTWPERMNDVRYDEVARTADPSGASTGVDEAPARDSSYLASAWNLNVKDKGKGIQLHRLNYVQPLRVTGTVNRQPTSPAPGHTVSTPLDLDAREVKFQVSLKMALVGSGSFDVLGFKSIGLWGAYTQQSNWQLYNSRQSRPFRETNYEPELIVTLGTGGAGRAFKLMNQGVVHQSNGRSNPESRSWNRLYAQGGWEWNRVSLLARGWWRLPESAPDDDNPDIEDYMGRAEVAVRWEMPHWGIVSLLARHNLRLNPSRGFAQLDWTTPEIVPSVRMHAQLTSGYGESLIDYNFHQNTFGVGLSLGGW